MGRRTLLYGFCAAVLGCLVIEAFAWLLYLATTGHVLTPARMKASRDAILGADASEKNLKMPGVTVPWNVPLHPYFGFGEPEGFRFLEDETPAQTDPNGFVVAITGGSVAQSVFYRAAETMRREVAKSPALAGKNVYVILLGQGCWKQPQQLTAVTYYLSLGGRLDVLVNLDGRNEVTDAVSIVDKGLFLPYPMLWNELSSNSLTPERARLVGELTYRRRQRYDLARDFSRLSFSPTAFVVWQALDRRSLRKEAQLEAGLQELEKNEGSLLPRYRSGPKLSFTSFEERLRYAAETWKRSSLQLHRLTSANGIRYFHFLQPNQYVPGSKIFSEEEKRIAFGPPHPGIVGGYSLLAEAGEALKRDGVRFHSLTGLFRNTREAVYEDSCCHFNPTGDTRLAAEMGRVVASALGGASPDAE